jgi:threonine 3-dehydrogenase
MLGGPTEADIGGTTDGASPQHREPFAMDAMWAIRKTHQAPGLSLERVPVPTPGAFDVLVRVEAASVCGTDLHIFRWDEWAQSRIQPPLTLGHEFAGTVVEVGSEVRNAAIGDYVSAESHVTCGRCFHCRTGRAHMCEWTQILGVDRDGAFAEYVVVPESVLWQNDRAKLPPEIATLQEPFGNAVFATSTQDLPGHTVAVLGCGPVGLFTIAIARASGAGRVLASDHLPYRLELAQSLGAEVVDVDSVTDAAAWFRDRNESEGLDVVFEMSGAAPAVRDAFRIVRNGGSVVLFGIPSGPIELDVAESLIFKNVRVTAVNGREVFATWYRTRWLLEHGVVDLRPLITHRLPLSDFEEAFAKLASGEACKIVLEPDAVPAPASRRLEAAAAR